MSLGGRAEADTTSEREVTVCGLFLWPLEACWPVELATAVELNDKFEASSLKMELTEVTSSLRDVTSAQLDGTDVTTDGAGAAGLFVAAELWEMMALLRRSGSMATA